MSSKSIMIMTSDTGSTSTHDCDDNNRVCRSKPNGTWDRCSCFGYASYIPCCGERKSKAYKARKKHLTKYFTFELLDSSAPVFVAAGINASATNIILLTSEERFAREALLFFSYAMLSFCLGKVLTFHMLRDESLRSRNPLFNVIRRYHLSHFTLHVISETAGFAWKEMFISFLFRLQYEREGGVSAAWSWLFVLIALLMVYIFSASLGHRHWFTFDSHIHQRLLNYDAEVFALPFAFCMSVLLGLTAQHWGFEYISRSSYLYTWKENYGNDSASGGGDLLLYLAYSVVVTMIVGFMMYVERDLDSDPGSPTNTNPAIVDESGSRLEVTGQTPMAEDAVDSRQEAKSLTSQIQIENPGTKSLSASAAQAQARAAANVDVEMAPLASTGSTGPFSFTEDTLGGEGESKAAEFRIDKDDGQPPPLPPPPLEGGQNSCPGEDPTAPSPAESSAIAVASGWTEQAGGNTELEGDSMGGLLDRRWLDEGAKNAYVLWWNKFLGYFAGLAYFLVCVDDFGAATSEERVNVIGYFVTLILAIVITWRGPSYLAAATLRQEQLVSSFSEAQTATDRSIESAIERLACKQSAVSGTSARWNLSLTSTLSASLSPLHIANDKRCGGNSSSSSSSSSSYSLSQALHASGDTPSSVVGAIALSKSAPPAPSLKALHSPEMSTTGIDADKGASASGALGGQSPKRGCCGRRDQRLPSVIIALKVYAAVREFYYVGRWKRKSIRMASMRLMYGWIWELVLQESFQLIFATGSDDAVLVVLESVFSAAFILSFAVALHLYVRKHTVGTASFLLEDKQQQEQLQHEQYQEEGQNHQELIEQQAAVLIQLEQQEDLVFPTSDGAGSLDSIPA